MSNGKMNTSNAYGFNAKPSTAKKSAPKSRIKLGAKKPHAPAPKKPKVSKPTVNRAPLTPLSGPLEIAAHNASLPYVDIPFDVNNPGGGSGGRGGRGGRGGGGGGGGGGAAGPDLNAIRGLYEQMYAAQKNDLNNRYAQQKNQSEASSLGTVVGNSRNQADVAAQSKLVQAALAQQAMQQQAQSRGDYSRIMGQVNGGGAQVPAWLQDQAATQNTAADNQAQQYEALRARLNDAQNQDFGARHDLAAIVGSASTNRLGADLQQQQSALDQDKIKQLIALMGG